MMKKIVIGLTGLIASGKSEAAKAFRGRGITVIDVDEFAHGLYAKGRPLYKELVKKYGKGISGQRRQYQQARPGRNSV